VPLAPDSTGRGVTVRVPAKVNLALDVGPRRPDGYHELRTVYQAVGLVDAVTVCAAASPACTVVDAAGAPVPGVPAGPGNLALRAVGALAARTGQDPAVRIDIVKGIPVAGGMAGGSADAAGALTAAAALWGLDDAALLADVAAGLGSDVPFLLAGGTALGTGRGERVEPVPCPGAYDWVLAVADGGLATPEVYAAFDRLPAPQGTTGAVGSGGSEAVLAALATADPVALGRALSNDLQPAALALRPALAAVLAQGRALGALGGVVSGSGPTVAFLAASPQAAADLAAGLLAAGLCARAHVARGPVPGARVAVPVAAGER
jgi:4-diphosphocytidyl-2-C-methyl-D-erythritol kinase